MLHVPGAGVSVVDWEFVGRGAPLDRPRAALVDAAPPGGPPGGLGPDSDAAGPDGQAHLETLAGWLCLRLLAENLAAPRPQRDADDLAHARTLVAESRALTDAR